MTLLDAPTSTVTLEEFLKLDGFEHMELINGVPVEKRPMAWRERNVQGQVVTALNSANAVDQTGISSVEGFVRVDSNVVAKVRQYLDAGVKVVWLVNPPQQDVVAYFADGQVKTLRDDDPLDVGDVLPDLDVTVRMIFAA